MAGEDNDISCILDVQGDEKTFRQNWARLIQKIYEVDPLVCPRCQGAMRVIDSIEDPSVIRAISLQRNQVSCPIHPGGRLADHRS